MKISPRTLTTDKIQIFEVRVADIIVDKPTEDQVLLVIDTLIEYYKANRNMVEKLDPLGDNLKLSPF